MKVIQSWHKEGSWRGSIIGYMAKPINELTAQDIYSQMGISVKIFSEDQLLGDEFGLISP